MVAIDYEKVSQAIIACLKCGEAIDEIPVGELAFVFKRPSIRIEDERVYTGVSFMGDAESYLKANIYVGRLELQGLYDESGNELACNFDADRLNLDYDDDDVCITYYN